MFPADLSYDPRDPLISVPGFSCGRFAVQVFTTDNVYGLAAEAVRVDGESVVADALSWAGQQQRAEGSVEVWTDGGALRVRAVHARESVKAVKVIFHDLPSAAVDAGWWQMTSRVGARRRSQPFDPLLWRYPWPADDSWPEWETPWAACGTDDTGVVCISVRSDRVRPVRLYGHRPPWADRTLVEVVVEEEASVWTTTFDAPPIEVSSVPDEAAALAAARAHLDWAATAHAIPRWEERTDVPAWFHDVRTVVTLHGCHWTGYVFNDFDAMGDALARICDQVDGRHVLAYVPGWEGRYYHDYPDYEASPLLGGPAGFDRLVARAHGLGAHVMPMFGIHGVNVDRFAAWPDAALRTTGGRMPWLVNRPDWDGDRAGEDGQVFCNPGHPGFRAHLLEQVSAVVDRHGVDGVFLDTSACWANDPDHPLVDGYRALVGALHARHPEVLVAGEGWFDALLGIFPVNQSWHGTDVEFRVPEILTRHARALGHLSTPAPGRGSAGVHESGWGVAPDPQRWPGYLAPGHLPVIAVVDDTVAQEWAGLDAMARAVPAPTAPAADLEAGGWS